ncbi:MAG: ribosomal protein S18-alanine N-acetyltransferase [Pyrinomonadaceae bacterium]|nr:ribosomal protein S18-alanine N-acetyltransferase [Pyrinomonadaceae bacterium]
MAVLQKIRKFFEPQIFEEEAVVPAPPTTYSIHPLTAKHLNEVMLLNVRCFKAGENYTKYTFSYLLSEPNTLSYRLISAEGNMVGFIFLMINSNGAGHVTTIGVAPEHRRRGLGIKLMEHVEKALKTRGISMITLEVRNTNAAAQEMYRSLGFSVVQRLREYYNNGEDGLLMVKSIDY